MIIRDLRSDDMNMIRHSFVSGVKQIEMTEGLDPLVVRDIVDKAIAQDWTVKILCDEKATDEIMAYVICQRVQRRLLWLASKPRYKGNLLGFKLMEAMISPGDLDCVFINPRAAQGFWKRGYRLNLRPYVVAEILDGVQ